MSQDSPNGKPLLPIRPLSGWGRYPTARGAVSRLEKEAEIAASIKHFADKTVIARGAARSYGDAAFNPSGVTLLMERLNRILAFDAETGLLRVEAGATLGELISVFLPRGWILPVVPGTKFVTIGGAVAADIHGKNHHKDGSFSRHVRELTLIDGKGNRLACSRKAHSEAFWATAGGMGLTGIISDVELNLAKVPSQFIKRRSIRAENLDALMQAFDENEDKHNFSVAWIDCLAGGRNMGRGVLFLGDFADAQLVASRKSQAIKKPIKITMDTPEWLLNRFSMSAFNSFYYSLNTTRDDLIHIDPFFFPLDSLHDWNRLYGKSGFIQYQCVLPPETSAEALKEILSRCVKGGWGSFLAVLKRFGPEEQHTEASISFPRSGYTITLDFPVRTGLFEFTAELDKVVLQAGGRVYLAKDACLSAETFRKMYPQWEAWNAVRNRLDPDAAFASALSKRLGLTK